MIELHNTKAQILRHDMAVAMELPFSKVLMSISCMNFFLNAELQTTENEILAKKML